MDKEIDEFENNIEAYVKIEGTRSFESFKIMGDFAEQISDEEFQKTLINALSNRKPFRSFKHEVESNGDYRQAWFDFKSKRFEEHVSQVLELANYDEEV